MTLPLTSHTLDTDSPIPLYHQLASHLRAQIMSGALPPGSRIPSESELASSLTIGRPTVRQATEQLVRDGWLQRRRGSGTYVQAPPEPLDVLSLAGTLSAFEEVGVTATSTLISDPTLADGNPRGPFAAHAVLTLRRLLSVESQPVLLEDLEIDPARFPGIENLNLAGESISRTLYRHWHTWPVQARQSFRVESLAEPEARLLAVEPNTAALSVQRTLLFSASTGSPAAGVFATLRCHTDQFEFSQTLTPPTPESGASPRVR